MPANTPNYAWPYQLLTDPPNGASLGHDGLIAADASLAAEQTARTNGDSTLTTALNASGLGRMGSFISTSGATIQVAEVKLGQFTFTAVAGRRYRLVMSGPQNNDTGNACLLRARWAAGATVTTSGAVILEVPCTGTASLTQGTCGEAEIAPGTLTAGTVAVGVFFQGNTIGSGNSKYGNGAAQPTLIYVEDIGT